jgi:hypothetical protein
VTASETRLARVDHHPSAPRHTLVPSVLSVIGSWDVTNRVIILWVWAILGEGKRRSASPPVAAPHRPHLSFPFLGRGVLTARRRLRCRWRRHRPEQFSRELSGHASQNGARVGRWGRHKGKASGEVVVEGWRVPG